MGCGLPAATTPGNLTQGRPGVGPTFLLGPAGVESELDAHIGLGLRGKAQNAHGLLPRLLQAKDARQVEGRDERAAAVAQARPNGKTFGVESVGPFQVALFGFHIAQVVERNTHPPPVAQRAAQLQRLLQQPPRLGQIALIGDERSQIVETDGLGAQMAGFLRPGQASAQAHFGRRRIGLLVHQQAAQVDADHRRALAQTQGQVKVQRLGKIVLGCRPPAALPFGQARSERRASSSAVSPQQMPATFSRNCGPGCRAR